MPLPRGVVAVLLGCLALAMSTGAMAVGDSARAKAAFDEGQRLFVAGDYRGALGAFEKGFVATDDAAFLLNMAQCHRSLGELDKALVMYRSYLKATPANVSPEARAVASKAIADIEAEIAATPPPPASATTAPIGGLPVLEPSPELDAAKAASAPAQPVAKRSSVPRTLRLTGLVSGGVGVVAVGVGFYYWLHARSLADSANHAASYDAGAYDQGRRAERMQWIFYGVGATAIATGAALYLYGTHLQAQQPPRVSLLPVVGPGAAGLSAQGSF